MIKVEKINEDEEQGAIKAEAFFHFEENKLVVEFDKNRRGWMEFDTKEEQDLVAKLLRDPNMWANFFGSLSAAIGKHR